MTKKRRDSRDKEQALERHNQRERGRERALELHYEQDEKHSPVRNWEDTPVAVPPSPKGKCDPETEKRFAGFFNKKEQGYKVNETIKKRKDYKNPALYDYLVKKFKIDEKGTNFNKSMYDPGGFTQDDQYESLAEHQKKQMEAEQKAEDVKRENVEPQVHKSKRR